MLTNITVTPLRRFCLGLALLIFSSLCCNHAFSDSITRCPIDADNLYALFKEYRTQLVNPDIKDGGLEKYFTSKFINDDRLASKDSKNEFLKYELRFGVGIHQVYSYGVSCDQTGIEYLIMSAVSHDKSLRNLKSWDPTKISIEYRFEDGIWRINSMEYDHREDITRSLDKSRVIDKFDDSMHELAR